MCVSIIETGERLEFWLQMENKMAHLAYRLQMNEVANATPLQGVVQISSSCPYTFCLRMRGPEMEPSKV